MARKAKIKKLSWQEKANQQSAIWIERARRLHAARRRHVRLLLWITVPILVAVVLVQLFYPAERGLPFASVNNRSLFWANRDTMARVITEQFAKTKLRLAVGTDKTVEFFVKTAGAEPDTETMISRLSDYPLWQRFIPGSVLWQTGSLKIADIYYNGKTFQQFIRTKAKELTFPPENARLAIENGRLKATNAVWGSSVQAEVLLKTISKMDVKLGGTTLIQVPAKRTAAARTSKDLAKVRAQAEATLAHQVTVKVDTQSFTPDKKELASWVVLATDQKGNVTLSIDKEKIKGYLATINDKVGTPAGQTNINIVNGREVGRTTGSMGRSIDMETLAGQLAEALLSPPPAVEVAARFVDVQPSVIFNHKYTATEEGLWAYVNDTARTRNMWISVQQLDGAKWSAAARERESIPSGSTYKLFVALVLFDKINKGEIRWEDPMLDTTVAGCFDRMTVASTNPCAESWIAQFGRQYINDFIHARGFSSGTSFTTGWANQTTAADLTKYMIGLNDGTLVSGANRDRLLNNLGRHPYRYGIPTGSAGQVNDKVGFLWDYVHDTAIVRHPRGTYILTIMTKGQSYGAIASVTREIERIMYP